MKLLKARLYRIEEQKRMAEFDKHYDSKVEVAFGSQIRSYVLHPYTLVRDERDGIDVKTAQVLPVLDGDLDAFMHAYLRHKTQKQHRVKAKSA
jgi:peptide chain release factor 2